MLNGAVCQLNALSAGYARTSISHCELDCFVAALLAMTCARCFDAF